jgi:predicted nucleotidyltransferase
LRWEKQIREKHQSGGKADAILKRGATLMSALPIAIPKAFLREFCERNHIRKLSLFGSVLTPRFRPESDIDVLVEFDPGHTPGLLKLAGMEIEISERLGRKVDLRTAEDLSRYFRDEVVASALLQFERTGEYG